MSLTIIILLCLAGLALIALDILVIPGGIIGFVGFGLMVFATIEAYNEFGTTTGNLFVLFTAIATGSFIYYIFRPKSWDRVSTLEEITGKMNTEDLSLVKPGDKGKAASALRPSGNALFHDKIIEVTTYEGTISAGSEIEVTEIEGHKIFVKSI